MGGMTSSYGHVCTFQMESDISLGAYACMHDHHRRVSFYCLVRDMFGCLLTHRKCILKTGFPCESVSAPSIGDNAPESMSLSFPHKIPRHCDRNGGKLILRQYSSSAGRLLRCYKDQVRLGLAGWLHAYVLPTRNPCGYVSDIGTNCLLWAGIWVLPYKSNLE